MPLETLPTEILWHIFYYAELGTSPTHTGFYYKAHTPDDRRWILNNRLALAHVCSRFHDLLAPAVFKQLAVSSSLENDLPFTAVAQTKLRLQDHVRVLDIGLRDDGGDVLRNMDSLKSLPQLARIGLSFETQVPTVDVQLHLAKLLVEHPKHVLLDLFNVPAEHLNQLLVVDLLTRVVSLVFEFKSPNTIYTIDSLDSTLGRMSALRVLKNKEVLLHGELNCFQALQNWAAFGAVRNLPVLEDFDIRDLSATMDISHALGYNWLPSTLTSLTCDWNLLQTIINTNDPMVFMNVKSLTVTMTRRFYVFEIPDMNFFRNVESLSLLRGPVPWAQHVAADFIAMMVRSSPRLRSLLFRGLYSSEVASMSGHFAGIKSIIVESVPDDSYHIGGAQTTSVVAAEPLRVPINRIILSAGKSLRFFQMHMTRRQEAISFPFLEALLLGSSSEEFPLEYVVCNYEVTSIYKSPSDDPINKIFTGFQSGRFYLKDFCTPLRSLNSFQLEMKALPFKRRDLFGPKRYVWDPIVVDITKLRKLLKKPYTNRPYQPLTSAVLFK